MKQFRTYTLGRKVTLLSDHHALQYLTTKAHLGNRRLQNWALTVQDCLGEVLYVPGKDMVVPDALSRLDPTTEPEQYLAERASVKALSARDSVIQAQAADAVIAAVKAKLAGRAVPIPKVWKQHLTLLREADGLLHYGDRIVVPTTMVKTVLSEAHESALGGHSGIA
jgi:hypothetical protein